MNVRFFLLFFLFGINISYSQGGLTNLQGIILDKNTNQPILNSYVAIPSVGYSSAANCEGVFTFSYPTISSDSLFVVSAMGYQNFIVKASSLSSTEENKVFLIPSKESTVLLGLSDARVFVQTAIDSIRSNFPSGASYQNGFYCEMVNYDKLGLVKVNEAILKVERFPNSKQPTEKVKYLRGRKFEWRGQTSKMDGFGIENGASIVSRSIETSLPSYLNEKELKFYEFSMDSLTTTFDDTELYVVSFKPINRRIEAPRTGKIYIEPISKAIVRIEYSMTPEAARSVMNTGFSNIKIEGKRVDSYMQFRRFNNKWMLQDAGIKFEANFEDKGEAKFDVDATISLRFVASVSLPLVRSSITVADQLTSTQHFPRARFYSDDFWESNNYILPTTEARKIQEHNN